jgi:hypothetical protein
VPDEDDRRAVTVDRRGLRGSWTSARAARMLVGVDEPEPGWWPGDTIYVDLPDGQCVRCRIVDVLEDGTVQVVPDHPVTIV